MESSNQFLGTERISKLMQKYAIPCIISLLVGALYNIVDQIFIANASYLGSYGNAANTVVFPLTVVALAIAVMIGDGCCAFVSISLGQNEVPKAKRSVGNAVVMCLVSSIVLTILYLVFADTILAMFGGTVNAETYHHSQEYFFYITLGVPFYMFGQAMNPIIRADGNPKFAMISTLSGAVINIILDPIFIFGFGMGIRGAALATILSQLLSAIWILRFLTSDKTILKLRRSSMHLSAQRVRKIVGLGLSGFTMAITNCTVQIMCNATLQVYGGDLYVGVMTVINSIREIATLPVTGVTHSAQPVLGFNYGAKEYGRVKKAIVFTSFIAILYTTGIWLIVDGFPAFFIRIFNQDAELIAAGIPAIRLYFFGFFMMSLQFSGQSIFVGLGKSKKAIFFSIFRKVIIVVPLTILLPGMFGMGTNGVFAAEPISNFVGGIACFGTMLLTIWRELTRLQKGKNS